MAWRGMEFVWVSQFWRCDKNKICLFLLLLYTICYSYPQVGVHIVSLTSIRTVNSFNVQIYPKLGTYELMCWFKCSMLI